MFEDYFDGPAGASAAYDEMYDVEAGLRTPYSQLQPSLHQMGSDELQTRVEALQSSYLDQGVTFDIGGEQLLRVAGDRTDPVLGEGLGQRRGDRPAVGHHVGDT